MHQSLGNLKSNTATKKEINEEKYHTCEREGGFFSVNRKRRHTKNL